MSRSRQWLLLRIAIVVFSLVLLRIYFIEKEEAELRYYQTCRISIYGKIIETYYCPNLPGNRFYRR